MKCNQNTNNIVLKLSYFISHAEIIFLDIFRNIILKCLSIFDSIGIDMFTQTYWYDIFRYTAISLKTRTCKICRWSITLFERKIRSPPQKKKVEENYSFRSALLIEHARCLIERSHDRWALWTRAHLYTVPRIPVRSRYSLQTTHKVDSG